jgi:nucleoside-diphosphate-sugar epimerase
MSPRRHGRVVVTGAGGSLAADILPTLRDAGYVVVGLDLAQGASTRADEWVTGSVTDRALLRDAFQGADAVIHLAGIPLEAEWAAILEANIDGTEAVLRAARDAAVRKVVLASSIHATGFTEVPPAGKRLDDDVPVRPDTYYGVSKAAAEALGSLYHDRYGLDVVCLRIASRYARPTGERMLASWLSPRDAAALFLAALDPAVGGFRLVWGVSANTRSYFSTAGGESIGFLAQDDAESFADDIAAHSAEPDERFAHEWDSRLIGGVFASPRPPMFPGRA